MLPRTAAAAVVPICQAPPATHFPHPLHSQIPTALRFTLSYTTKHQKIFDIVCYSSTKRASVFAMLSDFDLFDLFAKRGAVASSVFANNTDLLGVLSLEVENGWMD